MQILEAYAVAIWCFYSTLLRQFIIFCVKANIAFAVRFLFLNFSEDVKLFWKYLDVYLRV